MEELTGEPFILLEEGYAIMTMVEAVLGISILAELVLRCTNYNIVYIPIDPPVYRTIGVAYKDKNSLPIAVKYFIEYLTANRERLP
nr:LysR family transcriptional regulator substrate-binding protein [Enterocloster citroniae]